MTKSSCPRRPGKEDRGARSRALTTPTSRACGAGDAATPCPLRAETDGPAELGFEEADADVALAACDDVVEGADDVDPLLGVPWLEGEGENDEDRSLTSPKLENVFGAGATGTVPAGDGGANNIGTAGGDCANRSDWLCGCAAWAVDTLSGFRPANAKPKAVRLGKLPKLARCWPSGCAPVYPPNAELVASKPSSVPVLLASRLARFASSTSRLYRACTPRCQSAGNLTCDT